MVLLNVLLFLFCLSFSLGELFRFQILPAATVGPLDFTILGIVLVWLLKFNKGKYKLLKPIVLFSAIGIFSLLYNFNQFSHIQIITSSLYLIRWIFYSLIYFVFVDITPKFKKQIGRYVVFSGIIILVIGFAQFFLYPSLRNLYYLGWDEHLYRLFSTFLDPNFTGAILVLFFIFVFFLRDTLFSDKRISYGVLFFTFLGLILTYSRGALLMFAISAVTYSMIQRNLKIIIFTFLVFVGVFLVLSPRFYLENTNLLRTVSTKERLETSQKALEVWSKNPLGVGFDTYRYAREKYGETDASKFGPSHSGAGVDNSLILVLVTTGIPGIAIYIYLLYRIFRLGITNRANKYGLTLSVSLIGLVINSLTINSLFYSFIMVWIWMLAGLTESNLRE